MSSYQCMSVMRKILSVVLAALCAVSCGVFNEKTDPESAAKIEKAVKSHELTIDITQIYPFQGPAIQTAGEYTFKIHDGRADTHLPFLGESHGGSAYGTADAGININDCPVSITDDFSKASSGEYSMSFTARSGEEDIRVRITVWSNGRASITCSPVSRTQMNYSGDVVLK